MVLDTSPTMDRVFQALSHPARRAMLRHLTAGEQSLSDLSAPFKMSFPAASKHVRVLERAKLVRRRVVGRTHLCRICADPLKDVARWAEGYRMFWEDRFDALDAHLQEMKKQQATKQSKGRRA